MINKNLWIDKLGICLSFCCGIHCLVTVFLITLGTSELSYLLLHHKVDNLMSVAIILIGVIALLPTLIIHKNYGLIGLFLLGFIVLKVGDAFTNIWLKSLAIIIGTVMIIGTHYFNFRKKVKHVKSV
jgi:hypothetical protein